MDVRAIRHLKVSQPAEAARLCGGRGAVRDTESRQMWLIWVLTVLRAIVSCAAISSLLMPCAAISSTLSSRGGSKYEPRHLGCILCPHPVLPHSNSVIFTAVGCQRCEQALRKSRAHSMV